MRLFSFLVALFLSSTTAFALTPEFHGYLRAGAGTNGKGGKQECIRNDGTPGNEFRLGNECGIYGESAITAPLLKTTDSDPFFLTLFRFAYVPPGNSSWENKAGDGSPPISIVEAFVEGGRIDGSPLTYWIGKRFYRDVDVVINDWYYYGNMSGNGGGVGNIPLFGGTVGAALLFQTGDQVTNIGQNQNQVIDLRWQQIPISAKDQLNFWAAYGQSPAGRDAQNREYVSRNGFLVGTRWRRNLWDGFNDVAVVYGEKLMESMSLYGNAALVQGPTNPGRSDRIRVVNNLNVQPFAKLGLHAAATFETWNPRVPGEDQRGRWWNVGARPIWFLTKHTQLAFEAGHSVIEINSEKNTDGSLVGPRHLTRFTIAPQLAIDSTLWARPVLRLFYSYSFWNGANKSFVGKGAPSYAGATSGQNLGLQAEVWF